MRDGFLKVCRLYHTLLWGFAVLAGLCTFTIMWIIDANAIARKAFNYPIIGSVEITQSLLTVSIMLPFAYALATNEHVRTVILTSRLSGRASRLLNAFWMVVGFVIFALVTYGTCRYALRSYGMNEQVWGAGIRFPLWPAKAAVSIGTLLLSIEFLLQAIRGVLIDDADGPADDDHGQERFHA